MKIRPIRTKFFHAGGRADGRTDMTNLITAFRNFSNAAKMQFITHREEVLLLLYKYVSVNASEGRMGIMYEIYMQHINVTVWKNAELKLAAGGTSYWACNVQKLYEVRSLVNKLTTIEAPEVLTF